MGGGEHRGPRGDTLPPPHHDVHVERASATRGRSDDASVGVSGEEDVAVRQGARCDRPRSSRKRRQVLAALLELRLRERVLVRDVRRERVLVTPRSAGTGATGRSSPAATGVDRQWAARVSVEEGRIFRSSGSARRQRGVPLLPACGGSQAALWRLGGRRLRFGLMATALAAVASKQYVRTRRSQLDVSRYILYNLCRHRRRR